ncbi:MAG: DUF5320 domain-containing protein [bacterium]
MPYGDGTGPAGMGPLTGRRMGFCAGNVAPGYANPMRPCGWGMGFGRGGYGRRIGARMWPGYVGPFQRARQFFAAGPVSEKEILTAQASFLEENLTAVRERLDALKADKEENE